MTRTAKWWAALWRGLAKFRTHRKARLLWLRGLKRFHEGDLEHATRLFEHATALDSQQYEGDMLYFAILGRSYLGVGRAREAVVALDRALDLFRHSDKAQWHTFEWKQYILTLKSLANALHTCGQRARIRIIVEEVATAEERVGKRERGRTGY